MKWQFKIVGKSVRVFLTARDGKFILHMQRDSPIRELFLVQELNSTNLAEEL